MNKYLLLLLTFYALTTTQLTYAQRCTEFGEVIYKQDFGVSSYNRFSRTGSLAPTSPEINANPYVFSSMRAAGAGHYWLTNDPRLAWRDFLYLGGDHTTRNVPNAEGKTGNMLLFDAMADRGTFFNTRLNYAFCPGNRYQFSAWIANIWPAGEGGSVPNVTLEIRNARTGQVLGSSSSGNIPANVGAIRWNQYKIEFDAPLDNDGIEMYLINNVQSDNTIGNDLAIDDIELRECDPGRFDFVTPKTDFCLNESVTFTVGNQGYRRAKYQWQFLKDDGTWESIAGATNNSYTVANMTTNTPKTYRVGIGNVPPVGNEKCSSFSNPKTITITEPMVELGEDVINCDTHTLTAEGNGTRFEWFRNNVPINGATQKTLTVNNSGTYKVISYTDLGCNATDEVKVTINPTPIIHLSANPLGECIGSKTEIKTVVERGLNFTYQWYLNNVLLPDLTSKNITVTTPGVYKIIVSNEMNCSSEQEIEVIKIPNPTIKIEGTLNSCVTTTLTIKRLNDITAGEWFEWFKDGKLLEKEKETTLNVTTSGVYKAIAHNASDCTAENEVTVTINPLPNFEAPSQFEICEGSNAKIVPTQKAEGQTLKYEWYLVGEKIKEGDFLEPQKTGNYTVRGTNQFGCFVEKTIEVKLVPFPQQLTIEGATELCEGSSTVLKAKLSGDFSNIKYAWSQLNQDGTYLSLNQSNSQITVNKSGTYKVTIVNENGCSTEKTLEVKVIPFPQQLTIEGNSEICEGTSTILTANFNGEYKNIRYAWYKLDDRGNFLLLDQTNNQITTNNSGTYKARVYNENGCFIESNFEVKTIPFPQQLTIEGDTEFCEGGSTVLKAAFNGAFNNIKYTWSKLDKDGNYSLLNQNNKQLIVKEPGFYKIGIINEKGCYAEQTAEIKVNPKPTALFTHTHPRADDQHVTVFNEQITYAGNKNELRYFWEFGDGSVSTLRYPDTHTYNKSGTYTAKLTVTSPKGCSSIYETTFTVIDFPEAKIGIPQDKICINNTLKIIDQSFVGKNTATRMEWYFDYKEGISKQPDLVLNNPKLGQIHDHKYDYKIEQPREVTIRLVLYTATGHSSTTEEKAILYPLPRVTFAPMPELCLTGGVYQITEAKETSGLAGKGVFSGKGVSKDGIINPLMMGVGVHGITYTFTNEYGCPASVSQTVEIKSAPIINLPEKIILFEQDTYHIEPQYFGNIVSYKWSPEIGLSNPNIASPTVTLKDDQTYKITVTSNLGCESTKEVKFLIYREINPRNAFSPNGDGINDVWHIENLKKHGKMALVKIFNRQGELIHQQTGYDVPWNGSSINGLPLPVGTYFYVITKELGKKQFTGSVSIIK